MREQKGFRVEVMRLWIEGNVGKRSELRDTEDKGGRRRRKLWVTM